MGKKIWFVHSILHSYILINCRNFLNKCNKHRNFFVRTDNEIVFERHVLTPALEAKIKQSPNELQTGYQIKSMRRTQSNNLVSSRTKSPIDLRGPSL